jgi:transposase-like protein
MSRRSLSPEEEERIVSLYAEGKNSSQIAKELKLAYQTVHRRVLKFKAAEEQSGDGVEAETQGADASAIKPPASRKGSRKNGAIGAADIALTHISTREAYQGELLTFVHDLSEKTVSIEIKGQEPIRFKMDAFMMFARDVDRMKTLLSDMNASNTTEKAE